MLTRQTAGERDRESFASQMAKHMPALRALARVLVRNAETAEDLTQDTLARAWQARDSFAPGTNLKAWLFTIMRNHFRSDMRRAWRQMAWDQETAERIPRLASSYGQSNSRTRFGRSARSPGGSAKR